MGAALYTTWVGGDALATCLAFGLGAMAAIAIIGNVSGGHINPAVTLGAAIAGRLRWADVPVYWLAQVLGATIAGAVLRAVLPSGMPAATGKDSAAALFSTGANGYGTSAGLGSASAGAIDITLTSALIIEVVLGFGGAAGHEVEEHHGHLAQRPVALLAGGRAGVDGGVGPGGVAPPVLGRKAEEVGDHVVDM